MRRSLTFACVVLFGVCSMSCRDDSPPATPPRAEPRPHVIETHGDRRIDEYYWLREREDPEVRAYLEAENAYTDRMLAHTAALQERLFDEIVGRIAEDDTTVPVRRQDYWYSTRFVAGAEYPIHVRTRGSEDGPEEILLDVNRLADGKDYFAASGLVVSDGQTLLAYATDDVGRRRYTLRFRDLVTGADLPEAIEDVAPGAVWASDDRHVFYVKKDLETLREFQVFRHRLGTDPARDVLVFEEPDETFSVEIVRLKSREYVAIASTQTVSSEWRVLRADDPTGEFLVIQPRERDHEYDVDHVGGSFYIRTNRDAKNFRLVRAPENTPGIGHWTDVVPHRDDALFEGFELFRTHLVVVMREDGLIRLHVRAWDGSDAYDIDFGEPAYVAYPMNNVEIDATTLRYGYESLTTPDSVFDHDLVTRARTLRKREKVLGGFDPTEYVAERLHAPARDGVRIPISLVHRKGVPRDGTAPILMYGYGAYGISSEPTFRSERLSLLDRGFVYAIAHVRGGEELGRAWYEDGKLGSKMNTFKDFIDATEYLVEEGYAAPDRVFATGGSAGGLLMGAIVNLRPELWAGVVARVPFVDIVTTMLDPDIPLTTFEYDEWGDPNDPEAYRTMLSYSPYDNVEAKDYPPLLVTTGLHDSQVQYWEPAKWVARLRARKTDDNPLLLRINMEAGHGGASGRFRIHRETALTYAFILDLAGLQD